MFKILKNFMHLSSYYLEGETKEVRSDLVAGLTKEGFIEKPKVATPAPASK
jgi:hypothetical protein